MGRGRDVVGPVAVGVFSSAWRRVKMEEIGAVTEGISSKFLWDEVSAHTHTPPPVPPHPSLSPWDGVSIWTSKAWDEVSYNLRNGSGDVDDRARACSHALSGALAGAAAEWPK